MKSLTFLLFFTTILFCNSTHAQDAEEIFQRGNSLNSEGNFEEALIYVNRSLNMDSTLYQRYLFRADIKKELGFIESAISDVTKAINRCEHTTRKYHVSDYYLERAQLFTMKGDTASSLNDLTKSIRVNSRNWEAYNARSVLLFKSGNLTAALADLNKSVEIDDNQSTTFIARGVIKLQLTDTVGACEDFTRVANWGFDEFDSWIKENCK